MITTSVGVGSGKFTWCTLLALAFTSLYPCNSIIDPFHYSPFNFSFHNFGNRLAWPPRRAGYKWGPNNQLYATTTVFPSFSLCVRYHVMFRKLSPLRCLFAHSHRPSRLFPTKGGGAQRLCVTHGRSIVKRHQKHKENYPFKTPFIHFHCFQIHKG